MSSNNCILTASEQSETSMISGVALLPALVFNRDGKLAAIRLAKFLRGDIEQGRCEGVYAILYDHLHNAWGAPAERPRDRLQRIIRRTPGGRVYTLGTSSGATIGAETFGVSGDGRRIDLNYDVIGAATPATAVCHLSITYRGPTNLQPPPHERPHPLKNWQ